MNLSRLIGNGASSRVMKALGVFGGVQMLSIVLGVVRMKIVVLCLGAAGVGLFAVYNSIISLMTVLSQMNLRTTAVREIAHLDTEAARLRMAHVVSRWGLWLGLAGMIVTIMAAPLFSQYSFHNYSYAGWIALLAISLLFLSLNNGDQAVLQTTDRLRELARAQVWGVAGGVVVTSLSVWWLGEDGIVPSFIAGSLLMWLSAKYFLRHDPRIQTTAREAFRAGMPMIRLGAFMTLAGVVGEACNYIFISWLKGHGGIEEVGFYQSGFTVMNRYVGMAFTAVGVEFYPRISRVVTSQKRLTAFLNHEVRLLTLIIGALLVVFALCAPLIIDILYSRDFRVALPYIYCGLPGLALKALPFCLSFTLLARGNGKGYVISETVCCVALLGLQILLYSHSGLAGLGVASSLENVVYLLILLPLCRIRINLKVILTVLGTVTAITALTFALINSLIP